MSVIKKLTRQCIQKSLCYLITDISIKKNGDPDFEDTMGSFGGSKSCKLF